MQATFNQENTGSKKQQGKPSRDWKQAREQKRKWS